MVYIEVNISSTKTSTYNISENLFSLSHEGKDLSTKCIFVDHPLYCPPIDEDIIYFLEFIWLYIMNFNKIVVRTYLHAPF